MFPRRRPRTSAVLALTTIFLAQSTIMTSAADGINYDNNDTPASPASLLPDEYEVVTDPLAEHSDISVTACRILEDGSQRCSNNRKAAEWRPWPQNAVKNLQVYSNLCEEGTKDWPRALSKASGQWNKKSLGAVGLRINQEECDLRMDKNLTYIDNAIHVVYGSCGTDCCGKADVEYFYNGQNEIVKYSALVRIDRTCFAENGEFYGLQYILCHEMGHAIGLAHDYGVGSCMGWWDDSKKPGNGDVGTLLDLYGDNIAQPGKL
mmetsp:Transcript_19546/g.42163  ORF Transcript_19546/g.42163 Transcript_19546/m.42163 type:complete len:263 (-) Transcript_19546:111-899(-)